MKKAIHLLRFHFSSLVLYAQSKPPVKKTANQNLSFPVCSIIGKILDNRENDFKNIYTWDFMHTIPDDIHGYAIRVLSTPGILLVMILKLKFLRCSG
jgi:hypothetical protein